MFDLTTGKISFILVVAVLLACGASIGLARGYRSAMKRLMSAPALDAAAAAAVAAAGAPTPAPAPSGAARPRASAVTLEANRRAGRRVAWLLLVLSVLMACSAAWLFLHFSLPGSMAWKRLAVLALAHLWPAIPALGLLWRWSRTRMLLVLAAWCVLCFGVMLWRSIEPQPWMLLQFLVLDIGPPLLLVALLCLSDTTRASALWLLLPLIGLVWASIVGVDALAWIVAHRPGWLAMLPSGLSAELVMAGFAIAPWLVAWWPLRWLGRWLGRAYARKWLSELLVLFTAVWAVTLVYQSLGAANDLGAGGIVMLLPLAWIPLGAFVFARLLPPAPNPPTLLVLRVFQHDAQVQALYDHVVERWRLTGNTVLIAGTDLAVRTTDADDVFTYLDGGLPRRFINRAADVPTRLAAFDLERDLDGRFRINECYCHDTTWQDALRALVDASHVVLMDLRGFQAHNAGCRVELAALARARALARVVVLTDAQTDRATAHADAAAAPPGRFVWLDASRIDAAQRRRTLAALFEDAPAPLARRETAAAAAPAAGAPPKN